MTQYFLGVDIGNTKSHALICDEHGTTVGVGITGPGNHEILGKEGFQNILHQVVQQALSAADLGSGALTAAGYGIAGYDWSEDIPLMREVIDSLGMRIPYGMMNDSGIGLLAGSSTGWGVSVSAGTSANARGRDSHGREAYMTGNGLHFGEHGGGSEMVYRAVQKISQAWSKRAEPTLLADLFIETVGAKDVEDFLAGIARGRFAVGSKYAPLVFKAAQMGDAGALEIIHWIGEGLADLACGIINQLELHDQAFEVVLSGSIYQGSPLILETMRGIVHGSASQASFVHLAVPPVTGAVMLGMEQVGVDYRQVRDTIISTFAAAMMATR